MNTIPILPQEVHLDHVSPIDSLPVDFGKEEEDIQVSELLHNL